MARQWVHKWRSEEDAVLVGTKTAAHDNPQLNVREWTGRNPTRVVMDRFLRLPSGLHLFDRNQKTICYNLLKHEEHANLALIRLDEENFVSQLVTDLARQNIQSVIIEGGAQTLQLFLSLNLWDEARVFVSPRLFEKGINAPILKKQPEHKEQIGPDQLMIYYNH
jgi:diaminohydroxyphosphoribosylaminopyrimidine deaminase / 5-amino-6-(5-phosphoribosylamino)uracil reductase